MGCHRPFVAGCWAVTCILAANATPTWANDWETSVEPAAALDPWRALSSGITATPKSWVVYASTTIAPFDSLNSDGFRVRAGGGYGVYTYTTRPPAANDCRFGNGTTANIRGRSTFSDILAGYQLQVGALTVKAFAGAAIDTQALAPFDICNANRGRAYGVKGVLETWAELSPKIWLAVDGNWTEAHGGFNAQTRLGFRLTPNLSIGLEEQALGNVAGHQLRSGAFARYAWSWGEAIASGGISSQRFDLRDLRRDDTWASLNIMFHY